MRLKRLEIQGFKSFARPVCLEFGQGITAIVGPNGSGKSNISDALRWVLGEQSARSLRGQKMEDVIFAGSDGKRPLGMAEVQLTLDNSAGFLPLDYAEVTVTRRVYRSGDSEFFINKQNCRLRDIHDLFTDTGLGREGYSIIGQGQIDAVLSVRSEDRRILLEETAGIVKYRQRKEQALSKLEETSMDLLRVTDILHELENQLGPLGEQATQARLYLELADGLLGVELDYYHLTWNNVHVKWAEGEEKHKNLQQEYDHCNQKIGDLEEQKQASEVLGQALENEVEQAGQDVMAITEAFGQGVHTIQLHQERLKNQETRSKQLMGVLREKTEELQELQDEDQALQKDFKDLAQQIQGQEQTVSQTQKDLDELQARQRQGVLKVNQLKDDFFDFMRELAERRNFERSSGERRANLDAQINSHREELRNLEEHESRLNHRISELSLEEHGLANHLQKQNSSEKEMQAALERDKVVLLKQQAAARLLEGEITQVSARLKTLQELEEGYEGYGFGVRRIMQNEKMSKLVLGTVADVVNVPNGLETAFEVALGSSLQNLITPGEAQAKTLIAWLQEVQGGRVTILPLDTVRGAEFSKEAKAQLQTPGVLGSALDLLTFSEEYRPALASLLGRVVITETLETALALKKRLHQFSRIVTKDGSVVFPSGAMTGGSLNNRTSGLLARKGELHDLEEQIGTLQRQLEKKAQAEKENTAAITREEEELALLQRENVQTKLEAQRVTQTKEQTMQERQNLQKQHLDLERKIADLEEVLVNFGLECELAASQVQELERGEETHRAIIQTEESTHGEFAAQIERVSQAQTKERVYVAELKGSLENLRIQLANLEQRRKAAGRVQSEARQELEDIAQNRLLDEDVILTTTRTNEARKKQQDELQHLLEQKKHRRQEIQKENSGLGTELIKVQKEQLQRERTLYKWEVEQTQLEREREQILSALAERELTPDDILDRDVQIKETTLKRTMDDLRRQIRDLGLVNPGAAQEYERVQERCSFLQIQLEDLNSARESLQDVITEMDKLCRTKLWEVFQQVQVEFQKIFSQLFLGGTADLILTDPESILTTGIDVMARPPGKKLQNLLLLSGGERALTAIALLFAIRKVKPTPFWVLDEIDAALDESNLQRFTELMEDFAKETQFLVVTHRPKTMEAAHTLYGVTMGEDAFSQIISVALT